MSLELLTANLASRLRRERIGDRSYTVVPVSMIVPGVLPGSKGPHLYPAEECAKDPTSWNYVPIVLGHPMRDGRFVSARDADILAKSQLGFVLRSEMSGKLRGEAWFDEQQTRSVEPRVLEAVEAGRKLEVSTGLFLDSEPGEGVHNGRQYKFTARNFRPDHLAVLLDRRGACSVDDGCGLNVNDASFTEIKDKLQIALNAKFGWTQGVGEAEIVSPPAWVVDVFDSYVVYFKDGSMWKLGYSVLPDDAVELDDRLPVRVIRATVYKPISTVEVNEMAVKLSAERRKGIVGELAANCDCAGHAPWKGKTRADLEALSDGELQLMDEWRKTVSANLREQFVDQFGNKHTYDAQSNRWVTSAHGAPPAPGAGSTAPSPAANASGGRQMTADEWYRLAPPEVQRSAKAWIEYEASQKAEIIGKLTANVADQTARERLSQTLAANSLETLRDMLLIAPPAPEQRPEQPTANWWGAQGAAPLAASVTEEALPAPSYSYGK